MKTLQDNAQDRLRRHQDATRRGNLKLQLRRARLQVLTPRQQEMTRLYFDEGHTMAQIAQALEVHTSTVSRTLLRARTRLERHLAYNHPLPYEQSEKK